MKCKVECTCQECENLMLDEQIVIIKQYGLDEHREFLDAVKCRRYGMYASSVEQLKTSTLLDDMIWE